MSATGDRAAGFTLLETLTVLALTALISLIAFPSVQRATQAASLAQARATLASDLERARAQALRAGAPVVVRIAQDGGGYGWDGGLARRLAGDVRVAASGDGAVGFYPDASARPGTLVLSLGRRSAVVSVAATGAVTAR